jgi:hypothetical protein
VPRIIWAYWQDTSENPMAGPIVERCIARWRIFLSDFKIILLTPENYQKYYPDDKPENYSGVAHFADQLRIHIIRVYGGIWMDSSIILNKQGAKEIRRMVDTLDSGIAEYAGFYIGKTTTNPNIPVIENWFMVAIPNSRFINLWYIETEKIKRLGNEEYVKSVLAKGLDPQNLESSYLAMHHAALYVQERNDDYSLLLTKAEDSMFKLHISTGEGQLFGWFVDRLYIDLPSDISPFIKLRGHERGLLMHNADRFIEKLGQIKWRSANDRQGLHVASNRIDRGAE